MKDVQCVILAGGEGTRFRPLTRNRPQVLLPVANKAILTRVLDSVVACGIRDITVVVGYKKENVMKLLNSYPVQVNVVIQPKQFGTANALAMAKKYIHTNVLILPGDNFVGVESIRLLLEKENSILASPHNNPRNYGVIFQKNGVLTDIIEKPSFIDKTQSVSCGIYYFTPEYFNSVDVTNYYEMPDYLKDLIAKNNKINVVLAKEWHDALTPSDLLGINSYYLDRVATSISGKIDSSVKISGHVVIGKDTTIASGVVINGPAIIGENCMIEPNVYIGPGTSVGSRVSIESFSYLKQSIIMDDCYIGSSSRIVGAVFGDGCQIADHIATVGNVVAGDRVEIGPLTILKDCTLGNSANIDGGKTVTGVIPDEARVI